jgi:uncharacterized protein YegP (UPF0339 family)
MTKPVRTFEIYADIGGKYRWRTRARNGQITAVSGESFASRRNARRAAYREYDVLTEFCEVDFKDVTQ